MAELQRLEREQAQRRAVFVDWFDMDVLAALAENHPPQRVFITGPSERLPDESVLIDDALRAGWEIQPPYINESDNDRRTLSVHYVKGQTHLEVRAAAEWLGPDLHAALAQRAYDRLRRDLQALFGERAVLLASPAQTGQDLLERSLPRQKVDDGRGGYTLEPYTFPPVPDDVATLLYACMGQGRLETETFYRPRRLDRLYVMDGRFMYAACLSNLPNGPLTIDTRSDPPGWANGFLVASVRVPDEWEHLGLLPEMYRGEDGNDHRRYPRTPGQWFSSTMTTAEYHMATGEGWDVRIKRRILWHKPPCDPARGWNEKLQALRTRYAIAAERGDIVAKALTGTVRALLLAPIGLWFSHQSYASGFVRREDVPQLMADHPDAHLTTHGAHWYAVKMPRSVTPHAWRRPEWAAQAWGKCRAKLAGAALRVTFEDIAGLRTDSLVLTLDPGWPDTGKPGSFRLKEVIEGPLSAPRNEAEMRALLSGARSV